MGLLTGKRAATLAISFGLSLGAPGLASAASCTPYWKATPGSQIGATGFTAIDAFSAADAWAVGRSSSNGGSTSPVAHFDGTSWSLVSAPPRRYRTAIDVAGPNDVWTLARDTQGGTSSLEHFDGVSWSAVTNPLLTPLNGIAAVADDDVWAVGWGGGTPGIVHWDGIGWSIVPSPAVQGVLSSVADAAPDDVWALGNYEVERVPAGTGVDVYPLFEHWNGTTWSVVDSPAVPIYGFPTSSLAVIASNDIWAAVGRNSQSEQAVVEHWDGTNWQIVPTPNVALGNSLDSIAAVSASDVWAVGKTTEHWDGTTWQIVPSSKNPTALTALPDGTLFGAGGTVYQMCEIRVLDDGFSPASVTGVPLGATVAVNFATANTASHTVTDASGMGLFDSGLHDPGGSYTFTFDAAASYTLIDAATGHQGMIKVSLNVSPTSGTATTAFTATLATTSASAGYVYDVQVRRPGSTAYTDYVTGIIDATATFTPDAGAGIYYIRSRVRNTVNGAASGWSSAKPLTVS